MKKARIALAALVVAAAFLAGIGVASACPSRLTFFRGTAEGAPAHVSATNEIQARRETRNWCPVQNGSTIQSPGAYVFFAINNRSNTPGQSLYYTAKIFRHSRSSASTPLLSLWRSDYRPTGYSCVVNSNAFTFGRQGPTLVTDFFALQRGQSRPASPAALPYAKWRLGPNGRLLPFAEDTGFLGNIPPRVAQVGIGSWALNVRTQAFVTVPYTDREACFPVFWVTKYGEDQLIVELSNGSQSWTFNIAP